MYRKGKLYFRYGTMGSAKTALLLTTAYNFEERGMRYVCLKPFVDTRESTNVIRSRIGIERECRWIYHETDIYEMAREMFGQTDAVIDWILVDEAQFLTADQIDQLSRIVDDFGSNVICYGLRTDFKSRRKTIINARIDRNGDFVEEGEQVEIGGDERYIAVCRKCWRNKRIEQAARSALPFKELINN